MDEWRNRLRTVVAGWGVSPEEQASITDELEQHLDEQLAELRPRLGDTAALERIMAQVDDPALRAATIRPRHHAPASVQSSREATRGWASLARDFRYGRRALAASRGTSVMATIALALGIGLTTVMFSILYGTLIRGLPFDDGDRIMQVMRVAAVNGVDEALPMHEFLVHRDAQRSFETFGAFSGITISISGDERPERVEGAQMTAAALSVTRVRPALGRSFRADDEVAGGELVVMLSHALWRDRYASDAAIVGRAVRINGQTATVVGVMPEGFSFPNRARLWVPLRFNPAATPWGSGPSVAGVGRLRDGVTIEAANVELAGIAARIAAEHPQTSKDARAVAQPFIRASIQTRIYSLLYAMFGAVGLVFLVACTNVANLLLARAASRTKEVAIRCSLGASRTAIARQFLVEAFLLSIAAAALGAFIAQAGIATFRTVTADTDWPFWVDIRLHPQVFVFIAIAAFAASIVSGLLPAITAARSDITEVLKDQSLGSSSLKSGRLSRGLVVFELVLSSVLLVIAALGTKSVMNLRSVEPGFRSRDVLTAQVTLTVRDAERRAAFFERLDEEIARLPGAASASLSSGLPGTGWSGRRVAVAGKTYARPANMPGVRHLAVTPGFFKTFDVAVRRGRPITAEDRAATLPVAIVNQRFVDENFRDTDPIGQRINLTPGDSVATWTTIVGVMPNLYSASMTNAWPAEVLTAFRQEPHGSASIAIRTSGDPTAMAQPLRTLVASLDRDLPVYSLSPMSTLLAQFTWPMRIFGGLFAVFGVVALVLASIGLYAVMAFSVSRREREMGIRMALGAATGDIVRLVFRDGAVQLVIGVTIGLLLGVGAARLARSALFGVDPSDPATIAAVLMTLAATGFAACVMPALRATKADPVRSLRAE